MPLLVELRRLSVEFSLDTSEGILATLKVRPLVMEKIVQAQKTDAEVEKLHNDIKNRWNKDITYDSDGVLRMGKRIFMLNVGELRRKILKKAHCSAYILRPGSTKMYRLLR